MSTIIKHHTFYKKSQFYCSFPSILSLPNDNFLLVFRRARDSRYLLDLTDKNEQLDELFEQVDHIDSSSQLVSLSLDKNLQTVAKLTALSASPEASDQDASLLYLNNGSILLSSFSWYHIANRFVKHFRDKGVSINGNADNTSGNFYILWGGFTRLSYDNGSSWTEHNYLPHLPGTDDIIPGKRHSCGGPSRGQSIEVDGKIILPVYHYMPNTKTDTCHCYESSDGGKSWNYLSCIASDFQQKVHFQEPSLTICNNGDIVAFMRTAGTGDHLYTSVSKDQGKTWQEPKRHEEVIGHPTHPLKLFDGRIFISYGYRHHPFGIRARIMDEKAQKFLSDEIIIRDDGENGDLGYPWAIQLSDNIVLIVYYFNHKDGIRHIAGTTLEID